MTGKDAGIAFDSQLFAHETDTLIGPHGPKAEVLLTGTVDPVLKLGDQALRNGNTAAALNHYHRALSIGFVFILVVGFARVVGMSKRPSVYSSLLVAGLLFAGIGCYSGYSTLSYLEGKHGAFHRLVIDDRVSVDALARAAYTSTDANADESRYLIAANYNDTAAMQEWGDDFMQNRKQVEYENSVEGGNITYHPLEDQYYAEMVKYWNLYTTIDGQIRHAIAISNPNDPHRVLPAQTISLGISNDAFAKYHYYVQAD